MNEFADGYPDRSRTSNYCLKEIHSLSINGTAVYFLFTHIFTYHCKIWLFYQGLEREIKTLRELNKKGWFHFILT